VPDIELYRTVTRQLPDTAILVVAPDHRVLLAEGAAWPAGTLAAPQRSGAMLDQVLAPAVVAAVRPLIADALAGASREAELHDDDGAVFELRAAPLLGHVHGALIVSRNVTARRRLEVDLRRAQKLEAIGTLASGLAHDYNNLLMGMLGCADLALRFVPPDSRSRPFLEELKKAAMRGGQLTRQLLVFSRRNEAPPTLVQLDTIVDESERILRTAAGDAVHLVVQRAGGGWAVRADPGQLQQVLLNLVLNARDALPDGGTVTLTTGTTSWPPAAADRPPGLPPGDYATLRVDDDGVGMTPEVQAHIFEPFFTTKAGGHGTGLGLASVQAIVEQTKGRITVASEPGAGTRICVFLPRTQPLIAEPTVAPAPCAVHGPGLRVLVVDDESLVRLTVRGFLEPLGHQVSEACDRAEADLVCRRAETPIDVLITDVMLPGGTGREVARVVRGHCPDAGVVFMSAHPADMLVEAGRIPPGSAFLEKPFEEEALTQALALALSDPDEAVPPDGPPLAS